MVSREKPKMLQYISTVVFNTVGGRNPAPPGM